MSWPPSNEIRNTQPGLKMKDLKSSYKQKFSDASDGKKAYNMVTEIVLEFLIREKRQVIANDLAEILKRGKTPVRDALNALIEDNMVSATKSGRTIFYEATECARSQKADD
jgi:DNA-binding GntR family transcriptional regulator